MPSKKPALKPAAQNKNFFRLIRDRLKSPVVVVCVISLAFVLINVFIVDRARDYNSDDVAWQNTLQTWTPGNGHTAYFGSDPFIIKLPYYMIMQALFTPARGILLFTSLLFAALNFLFFYYALLYFYRLYKVPLTFRNLLPMAWLASFGLSFASLFLNPNLRNFELGLMFVLFMFASKIYYQELRPFKNKLSALLYGVGCLIVGILIVNDLYFFYFGVLPLGGLIAWLTLTQKKRRSGYEVLAGLGLSVFVAKVIHVLCERIGIDLMKSVGDSFVGIRELPAKVSNTTTGIQSVFNANFWDQPVTSAFTLALLLNALVLVGILYLTWRYVLKGRRSLMLNTKEQAWQLFFPLLFIFVCAVYTITTVSGVDTYRYLVILPFISVLLAVPLLNHTTVKVNKAIAAVFIIGIFGNFYLTLQHYRPALTDAIGPNQINADLVRVTRQHNLTRGYAQYWDGNINTYFSKGEVQFLPAECGEDGNIRAFRWLVDGENMRPVEGKQTFLMIDPARFDTSLCTSVKIANQFGVAQDTFEASGRTFYVYNYDIGTKFH